MNSDQLNSLVRTALKIAGALCLQHGLTGAADLLNSPDIIGAVLLIAGLVWSHYSHAAPKSTSGPSSTPPSTPPLMAILWAIFAGSLFFTGCASSPQQATYQAAGTTVVSVDTAMNLWGAYVAANHPSTNLEAQVENAYDKYQASMAIVCDAGAAYAATGGTNATATAALNTAVANSSQELTDLENMITSFGVKLQ
jgi:hypothetical protein